MSNKEYNNQLTKPRQIDYRNILLERAKMKREKLEQERIESDRRHIATYYGMTNPND